MENVAEAPVRPKPTITNMKSVVSSQIDSIGYDEDTKTLAIMFKSNKKVYHYYDVPKHVFDGFFARPDVSIGSYFAANVREVFEYKAITA